MLKSRGEIKEWLHEMNIEEYDIHDDLTVDVYESVDISHENLDEIPIQFGIVNGDFSCSHNNLKSLKGSPIKVKGFFHCGHNELTNLEHCPIEVSRDFFMNGNQITSLEHFPNIVGGGFYLGNNPIQSLTGFKTELGGELSHIVDYPDNFIPKLEHLYKKIGNSVDYKYELQISPNQIELIFLQEKLNSTLGNNSSSPTKKSKM